MPIPNKEIREFILNNKNKIEERIGRKLINRKFKFRAFTLRDMCFCHGFCISNDGDFAEMWKPEKPSPDFEINEDMIEFIIQQFTGIYDMDGKEIYEGDILESRYGKIGEVIYDEIGFRLLDKYGEKVGFKDSGYKVIGNIYTGIKKSE